MSNVWLEPCKEIGEGRVRTVLKEKQDQASGGQLSGQICCRHSAGHTLSQVLETQGTHPGGAVHGARQFEAWLQVASANHLTTLSACFIICEMGRWR